MKLIGAGLALVAAAALAGCEKSKFRTYSGPEVTQILVLKEQRKMYLLNGQRPLKKYDIALGGNPVGDKQIEGDLKTPEGGYVINRRNPNSAYHLSLGISYPNASDVEEAKALGKPRAEISSSTAALARTKVPAQTGPPDASP